MSSEAVMTVKKTQKAATRHDGSHRARPLAGSSPEIPPLDAPEPYVTRELSMLEFPETGARGSTG